MRLFYYFYSIRKDLFLFISVAIIILLSQISDISTFRFILFFVAGFIFAQNYKKLFRYFFNMFHYRLRDVVFKDGTTICIGTALAYESVLSTEEQEIILSVAIRNKNGLIFIMGRPYRHLDLLNKMEACYFDRTGEQGFMTSRGRFVDRFESRRIALLAKQITNKHHGDRVLMSEDIW